MNRRRFLGNLLGVLAGGPSMLSKGLEDVYIRPVKSIVNDLDVTCIVWETSGGRVVSFRTMNFFLQPGLPSLGETYARSHS